ncbi:thiamine pyrophosphate-binding protein [Chondromyces apiculatus]|uniref:thiamine pyrophosphate-binding protein n=1 Tax=Chondromyces apiculatus TaxID=51 RepID=UPI0018CC4B96|nr:thiamine pyrophosphate-dependent enzyme [Chondromyces apiculatus]
MKCDGALPGPCGPRPWKTAPEHRERCATTGRTRVREAVATAIHDSGATMVFCLMGATNQHLIDDLSGRLGMRLVHARHESGAVGMADGYARFGGGLAVATVTAGPGLTNTATALAVAAAHRSPVLLLAGDVPGGNRDNPQYLDQPSFTRLCAGTGLRLDDPGQLDEALAQASLAMADGRPFALHLPADVQEMPAPDAEPASAVDGARADVTDDGSTRLDARALDAAVDLLAGSARPVLVAGRGALHAGPLLLELAREAGAVVATTLRAAGLFAGDRAEIGITGGMGDGRADDALAAADLVIAVGTTMHPLSAAALHERPHRPPLVRIDTAPAPQALRPHGNHADHGSHRNHGNHIHLRGDAALMTTLLLRRLRERRPRPRVLAVGKPPLWQPRSCRIAPAGGRGRAVHPIAALEALEALLPRPCNLVIGGGHAALSACQVLTPDAPDRFTCVSTDFGAIGQALAVALGACFARPGERVVHVTGDGDLLMSLAELPTAARYGLPLTIVVLNDHGFGQERHNLARAGGDRDLAEHPAPDLAALARACGCAGDRITRPEDLPRLREALTAPGPTLIDLHIDPEYLNPASATVARAMARSAQ